ncbi:MAG TPA: acyl-CoA dehydrogenase family protein, partial [Pseudolysinimonas sp.]|nr:acyl-CoA dehydrogenase family protein [Pseudolysinimonas sp.]
MSAVLTAPPETRAADAAAVAASHADEVDAAAGFPHEAMAALAEARLLGASVPVELGGEGLTLTALADIAATLGAACSSTGMIFAMHHSQVLSLTRHLGGSPALATLASRIAT